MTRRSGQGAGPLVVLALIALLPALALFVVWRWAAGQAAGADPAPPAKAVVAAPPPAPVLSTPLMSMRRAPAVLSRSLNDDALASAVAEFADSLNDTSCVAVSVDGVAVGSANGDMALIPASNQKLLTAAVALDVLGAETRYTTEVRAQAPSAGVVAGDLFLVGGGDPLLTSSSYPVEADPNPVTDPTSLDALADAVVAAGITSVEGSVIGDGSRYDDEFYAPSWSPDVRVTEAGPYDALVVNDARVTGDPLKAGDPAEGAAREFTALLRERGVVVAGEPGVGQAPDASAVVGSVQSAPMSAVVGEMLATSDNNTSEMVVKELGFVAAGAGTRDAGLGVMRTTLEGWGLTGLMLADGSGLSNDNRVSCDGLAAVLARSGPADPLGAGLAVAGETGTLEDVFTSSPVAGRLLGKTGTLGNPPYNQDPPAVKSLSGYLPVDGGGAIEFALVLNGSGTLADQGVYRPIWDAFVAMLATYPSGPSPAELQPR
ncbi:MAG: D-alanyl-D-alanine carboxypeptidase [Acidimicrobiia bacterium]|nr:D-alanyl-D-alanine carboxypeptidase [Acidimicrobiia bacterium]